MTEQELLEKVALALDRRRLEITRIKRIVSAFDGTIEEQTAATMAIPMLYAHWEGFVHECCSEYVEFLEKQALMPAKANPAIFAFSLRKELKRLTGEHTVERITSFVRASIEMLSLPIRFRDKKINTKSNLKFDELSDLCASLGISVKLLQEQAKKITALVEFRNEIAHGGRGKTWSRQEIDEYSVFVVGILEDFERVIQECVRTGAFLSPRDSNPAVS